MSNLTIKTTLDLCSEDPGEWIPADAVQGVTGREPAQQRGDYGGFGVTLRTRFKRSNPPFQVQWAAGGTGQQYYRVDTETAEAWKAATRGSDDDPSESVLSS